MKMKRTLLLIGGLLVLLSIGCRQRAAVDAFPGPPEAFGTITGTVRGPEASSSIEGRTVEVVNLDAGERQQTNTSHAGGFTFKVKPGTYRVRLALADSETLIKGPGRMNVNRAVDAHADFIIGAVRLLRPRAFAPTNDPSLGPPIG